MVKTVNMPCVHDSDNDVAVVVLKIVLVCHVHNCASDCTQAHRQEMKWGGGVFCKKKVDLFPTK